MFDIIVKESKSIRMNVRIRMNAYACTHTSTHIIIYLKERGFEMR